MFGGGLLSPPAPQLALIPIAQINATAESQRKESFSEYSLRMLTVPTSIIKATKKPRARGIPPPEPSLATDAALELAVVLRLSATDITL